MAASLALLAACHDLQPPTAPVPIAPVGTTPADGPRTAMLCRVEMAQRTLSCTASKPAAAPGVLGDRIIGGQDVFLKLVSTGTAYDNGAEIFSTNVTLQNLSQFAMGTTDGIAVAPIRIFFHDQPTNGVTVDNPDGFDTFTGSNQPYFSYGQIVGPYEISASHPWRFNVPTAVLSFTFTVYVSAPQTDEIGTLLDRVWQGTTSTDWMDGSNWRDGAAPVDTSTVVIPNDTLIVGAHSQPMLSANDTVRHLRVGFGSTLDQAGFILTASGNVDAVGAITSGTTVLTGSTALLGGTVDALVVTGNAKLQRPTVATGAVTVTGSLAITNQPLSITIP